MPRDHDDELKREIQAHLELEAEERVADGMSEADARYAARRAFGSVTRTQEDVRAVWTRRWIEEIVQDVRYALRMLRKSSWIHHRRGPDAGARHRGEHRDVLGRQRRDPAAACVSAS